MGYANSPMGYANPDAGTQIEKWPLRHYHAYGTSGSSK